MCSYNQVLSPRTIKRVYAAFAVANLLLGVGFLYKRDFFFGVCMIVIGIAWAVMSTKNPPAQTAVQPAGIGSWTPLNLPDPGKTTTPNPSDASQHI